MSARAEMELKAKLGVALTHQHALSLATERHRHATVAFMDEALRQRWSWNRMGEALGISGTGARRYYERNRRRTRTV